MPIDLSAQPLAIFAAAGAVVWFAGTRLTGRVDTLAERTGLGRAFAGMLLLGGITSLPEVATVATPSATGNPALALNKLLGSTSINVLLLAVCDQFFGREPLTVMTAKPVTLMQGGLGMLLLAGVVVAAASGDFVLPGLQIGIGSLLLAAGCIQALRMAARFERQQVWDAVDPPHEEGDAPTRAERPKIVLVGLIALAALTILCAGAVLSLAGDAIAGKTGLGASLVGFALVGLGASLPELSLVVAALKLRPYEMAIGDIFGTNLFDRADPARRCDPPRRRDLRGGRRIRDRRGITRHIDDRDLRDRPDRAA